MSMFKYYSPITCVYIIHRLLLQIHDELIFEVPDEQIQQIAGLIVATRFGPLVQDAKFRTMIVFPHL